MTRYLDNTTNRIDAVARTKILPQLKISQCPIYVNKNQLGQDLSVQQMYERAVNHRDILYSPVSHGKCPRHGYKSTATNSDLVAREQMSEFLQHVKIGREQRYALPTLPTKLVDDFVPSWVSQGAGYRWSEQNAQKPFILSKCRLVQR